MFSNTTLATVLLCAISASACDGGGSGDPLAQPAADPFGNGARLHELLGPASWVDPADVDSLSCEDNPLDRAVYVTGVTVSAVDSYDETASGSVGNYYVQDSLAVPVPYSGITVFDPGFSPPDLRVIPGDVMDILGALTEFPGPTSGLFPFCRTLPEMSGAMEFRFEDHDVAPTVINVADLASYDDARQWLGMLVTVEQVTLLESAYEGNNGRYSFRIDAAPGLQAAEIPTITNELFDLKAFNVPDPNNPPLLAAGSQLQSVTGIVTYFYGVHIAPRSEADLSL